MNQRIFVAALALVLSIRLSPLLADEKVTLKSHDGLTQIVLPEGWVAADSSNSAAVIEGRNEDSNVFVMVVIADRSDPYITLAEYTRDRRNEVMSHLVRSKCSQAQESQWNGYNAIQYEIHGIFAASKTAFGYFLTIVEVKHHYLEVVGWAVEENFQENAQTLREAANNVTYTGEP
ncbi:MAG: hypothetical protein ABSB33_08620 [Tepidisphaeraceae bacterium]|jgi:hypothetical protein